MSVRNSMREFLKGSGIGFATFLGIFIFLTSIKLLLPIWGKILKKGDIAGIPLLLCWEGLAICAMCLGAILFLLAKDAFRNKRPYFGIGMIAFLLIPFSVYVAYIAVFP
jgi:hypothetical protein